MSIHYLFLVIEIKVLPHEQNQKFKINVKQKKTIPMQIILTETVMKYKNLRKLF